MSVLTLRALLARLEKQGYKPEQYMDLPIAAGIHDGNNNFDIGTLYDEYPRVDLPFEQYGGVMRLSVFTTNKRLVEKTARQKA